MRRHPPSAAGEENGQNRGRRPAPRELAQLGTWRRRRIRIRFLQRSPYLTGRLVSAGDVLLEALVSDPLEPARDVRSEGIRRMVEDRGTQLKGRAAVERRP